MLVVFFAMYHEPMDFAYAGYMAVVGELVEHVGEATGQCHYPGQPWGGVPLWLLPLWAGSDCLHGVWSCLWCSNRTGAKRHDDYTAFPPRRYGCRRRAPSGPPSTGSIEIQRLR